MRNPKLLQFIRQAYQKKKPDNAPGYGRQVYGSATRLVNPDGQTNIIRRAAFNFYQYLISISWWQMPGILMLGFIIN